MDSIIRTDLPSSFLKTARILAIDPAMDNTGWMLLKVYLDAVPFFYTENCGQNQPMLSPPTKPYWITEKDTTGKHLYDHFEREAGGTHTSDSKKSMNWRISDQADRIHKLVTDFNPDILVLESQLDKGDNKNPYGVALQIALLYPYFRTDLRFPRFVYYIPGNLDPSLHYEAYQYNFPIPRVVITIRPERLQSIAHYQRSTTGGEVVRRYKHLTGEKRRLSQHEADSFYLGYHAARFWATCINSHWSRDILTQKENHVFLESTKGMLYQMDDVWWINSGA